MDKRHVELAMLRSLTTDEFIGVAREVWGGEGRELADFCAPKAILLIGAGASRASPVNLPVMSEFMKAILENAGADMPRVAPHLVPRWKAIAPTLRSLATELAELLGRPADLEELLCLLQILKGRKYAGPVLPSSISSAAVQHFADRLGPVVPHAHELHKLRVYRILETYSVVRGEDAAQLYGPILQVVKKWLEKNQGKGGHLVFPILTTNYDRCIEAAVESLSASTPPAGVDAIALRLVDGFVIQKTVGFQDDPGEWIWSPAVDFRGDGHAVDRSTGQLGLLRRPSKFLDPTFWTDSSETLYIPYFKIHGSLNWAYTQSVIAKLNRENWLWSREELPFCHKLRSRVWPDPPFFIPFLWEPGNKERFTNAYQQIAYEFFRATLEKVRVLICSGYSFRDEHLLSDLRHGLE